MKRGFALAERRMKCQDMCFFRASIFMLCKFIFVQNAQKIIDNQRNIVYYIQYK